MRRAALGCRRFDSSEEAQTRASRSLRRRTAADRRRARRARAAARPRSRRAGARAAPALRAARLRSAPATRSAAFDARRDDIRLYWARLAPASPTASFAALAQALDARGRALRFAMNAGMFEADLSPVGLYVEDGKRERTRRHARGREQFPSEAEWNFLDRRRRRRRRGNLALSRQSARRRASPPSPGRCW